MAKITITVEHRPLWDDDPLPYIADIIGDTFDHHGVGANPSEALLLAASHWHARAGTLRKAKPC